MGMTIAMKMIRRPKWNRPAMAVWLASLCIGLCFPCMIVAAPPKPDDKIKIERAAVVVEVKEFDPAHPPNPAPPLEPGESAVCVYRFEVEGDIHYTYRDRPGAAKPARPGEAAIKSWEATVESMSINLALKVTIWLPTGAGDRLTAHEHGHRQIAEAYYAKADAVARGLAAKIVGKPFVVAGADPQAVIGKQVAAMNLNICAGYLNAMNRPCDKAQKVLDELTHHGTWASPTTEEAVKKALEPAK